MGKKILVIGGGPTGIECSSYLANLGFDVCLIEKEAQLGGKLNSWDRLFPTFRPSDEVKTYLENGINLTNVKVLLNTVVENVESNIAPYKIHTNNGEIIEADAVVVATGFEIFDARKKEEYGYGIYENVITSKDLEQLFREKKPLLRHDGKEIKRVGFVHCVGSRDEKVGNAYCSKVCCVTGVKQSIEIHEILPNTEIFCFYMDLRMFGLRFEELYKKAQIDHSVQFVRGRLSEAAENIDGSVIVKVEDTLNARPLKMNVDLLVLLVGMVPSQGTLEMAKIFNIPLNENGFLRCADEHTCTNITSTNGVFIAGSCSAPETMTNSIIDGRNVAVRVAGFLNNWKTEKR